MKASGAEFPLSGILPAFDRPLHASDKELFTGMRYADEKGAGPRHGDTAVRWIH
jgi:hypothetical protein